MQQQWLMLAVKPLHWSTASEWRDFVNRRCDVADALKEIGLRLFTIP